MFGSLFNKVAGLQACYFIKKILRHRCFPLKSKNTYFEKHLEKTTFQINASHCLEFTFRFYGVMDLLNPVLVQIFVSPVKFFAEKRTKDDQEQNLIGPLVLWELNLIWNQLLSKFGLVMHTKICRTIGKTKPLVNRTFSQPL